MITSTCIGQNRHSHNRNWKRLLIALAMAHASFSSLPPPASAQTVPRTAPSTVPSQTQSPVTISPIQPSSAPTSGLPANILTPSTTNQLEPSSAPGTNRAIGFSSAGRGLPGMPGGSPVNGAMGAQDPTGNYMRPPAIGPLFCDPGINIPC